MDFNHSSEHAGSDSSSNRQLIDILAEDFAAQLRRGKSPSIESYAEQYPEIAEQIRDLFPALQLMDQVAPAELTPERSTGSSLSQKSRVGDYQVIRKIGQGGMGVVYEAQQESLGRRVALKVLPSQISRDEKFIERFKREARAAAKLHHTNIVPVFEVGQEGETLYYAMQFIEGQALDEIQKEISRLRQQGSSTSQTAISKFVSGSEVSNGSAGQREQAYFHSVAKLGASIADALGYAHDRSIIHRDVKPSNLILDTQGVVCWPILVWPKRPTASSPKPAIFWARPGTCLPNGSKAKQTIAAISMG